MPEVLRGPHLGITSELLTYLTCLAVAWGLSCWPPEVGRLGGVLGWAKWPVCEIWVSMYVHLISQIHPKSSVPYDFSMGFYRERTIFPYL